jgi:hypothetical protein
MKPLLTILTATLLSITILHATPDNNSTKEQDLYNNKYCHDPEEIEMWDNIIKKDGDNDMVQALHSLWLGLCAKVEAKEITANRAQKIFEDAKNSLLEIIEKLESKEDEKVEL